MKTARIRCHVPGMRDLRSAELTRPGRMELSRTSWTVTFIALTSGTRL